MSIFFQGRSSSRSHLWASLFHSLIEIFSCKDLSRTYPKSAPPIDKTYCISAFFGFSIFKDLSLMVELM